METNKEQKTIAIHKSILGHPRDLDMVLSCIIAHFHICMRHYTNAHNLLTSGVRLHASHGFFQFRARFGFMLCDELAVKETFSVKGASGLRPCLWCDVISRCRREQVRDDLTHFSDPDLSRSRVHTPELFVAMADALEEASRTGNPEFETMQKHMGLVYDTNSIIFDREMRHMVERFERVCVHNNVLLEVRAAIAALAEIHSEMSETFLAEIQRRRWWFFPNFKKSIRETLVKIQSGPDVDQGVGKPGEGTTADEAIAEKHHVLNRH